MTRQPKVRANACLIAAVPAMKDMIAAQIEAAQQVVDNWSRGDLAGAVNALEEVTDAARAILCKINDRDQP